MMSGRPVLTRQATIAAPPRRTAADSASRTVSPCTGASCVGRNGAATRKKANTKPLTSRGRDDASSPIGTGDTRISPADRSSGPLPADEEHIRGEQLLLQEILERLP